MSNKKKDNYILGITGLTHAFHDNSAVLLKNGEVKFAASEERYSRIKHDRNFPKLSIKEAFKHSGITVREVSYVAVGYPKRFFLDPFIGKDFTDLISLILSWIKGRGAKFILDSLKIIYGEYIQNLTVKADKKSLSKAKVVYVGHHLAHASASYYTSGYTECLAVSLDAFGPKLNGKLISGAVYLYKRDKEPILLEEIPINASIGLFYTSVTQALGFTPGDGEGKTMGLAAYGNSKLLYKNLKKLSPLFRKDKWSKSEYWAEMFFATRKEFKEIFDILPLGKHLKNLINKYGRENVAAAAQNVLEDEVVEYFKYLRRKYELGNFALGGGLFFNVKMNKRIREIDGVKDIFVHPNAGDGGTALGAAYYIYLQKYGCPRNSRQITDVSWGTGYSQKDIEKTFGRFKESIHFRKVKNISKEVAKEILEGKVVGWFQGRSEWGPRALGYRSVLIDPRRMDIKDRLNNTLKNREWFMPFAPSILSEFGDNFFYDYTNSPFMTLAFDVRKNVIKKIRAAIHIDNTARPNSVTKEDNPLYYAVINNFYKLTGIPVVLNTSFNKHGLPIVNSPEDAINHLIWNCIDELAIGCYLVERKEI